MIYNWTISQVERQIELEGLADVITAVHYRYSGTTENGTSAEVYGVIALPSPNSENFKSFDTITSAEVSEWIENIFSEKQEEEEKTKLEQMQESILNRIDLIENPRTITSTLNS